MPNRIFASGAQSPKPVHATANGIGNPINLQATTAAPGTPRRAQLPDWTIPAAKRFAAHWRVLPTHHKMLHALAHAAGLTVTHTDAEKFIAAPEREGWLWIGTETAFRASGLLKPSAKFQPEGCTGTHTGEGLTLALACSGARIFALHERQDGYGPRSCARFAAIADADEGYQRARALMLQPVHGLQLPSDLYDWSGPIRIEVPQFVAATYVRRHFGRFPRIGHKAQGGGAVCVTVTVADALMQHALYESNLCAAQEGRGDSGSWMEYARHIARAIQNDNGGDDGAR